MTKEQLGRPKIEINIYELIELMAFYPSLEETANWFNCSQDTIERFVRDNFEMTFADFRFEKSGKTRIALKRLAIHKALNEENEKLLIYCLRTLTDLDDRDIKVNDTKTNETIIKLAYSCEKDL